MKKQLFSLILFTLFSCEKDAPIPEENKQLATSFQATILEHEYRLTSYKSDVPIDYDPTDTVPAKTDHWEYVSYHLKDDEIIFTSNSQVSINQNANLMAGTTGTIVRQYSVIPDQQGVAFNYLNFTYDPLTYRLVSFTDSTFIVRASWNGNDVTSTFKALP